MSEIARHQLLITLVHGTWPRGFFRTFFPRIVRFKQRVRELTRRQRRDPPPFWFEECSPFLARLSSELGDISYKIKPLLWSGENSIYERDKTAQVLAEHLSAEHAEHPQATQLVIAHSHGGNIALRALHHLHQRDASRSCGAESANPLVVTLATPFVEVQPADFGDRPTLVRLGVLLAIALPLLIWAPVMAFGKKDSSFGRAFDFRRYAHNFGRSSSSLPFHRAELVVPRVPESKTESGRSAEGCYAIGRDSVSPSPTIVDNQSD
jgi:hypothetical protein